MVVLHHGVLDGVRFWRWSLRFWAWISDDSFILFIPPLWRRVLSLTLFNITTSCLWLGFLFLIYWMFPVLYQWPRRLLWVFFIMLGISVAEHDRLYEQRWRLGNKSMNRLNTRGRFPKNRCSGLWSRWWDNLLVQTKNEVLNYIKANRTYSLNTRPAVLQTFSCHCFHSFHDSNSTRSKRPKHQQQDLSPPFPNTTFPTNPPTHAPTAPSATPPPSNPPLSRASSN